MVKNGWFVTMLPLHWTVLDVWVDDTAAP